MESDPDNTGIGEDTAQGGGEGPLHGQGGEGREKEKHTQSIGDESEPGQTQTDSPGDEAGGHEGADRTD